MCVFTFFFFFLQKPVWGGFLRLRGDLFLRAYACELTSVGTTSRYTCYITQTNRVFVIFDNQQAEPTHRRVMHNFFKWCLLDIGKFSHIKSRRLATDCNYTFTLARTYRPRKSRNLSSSDSGRWDSLRFCRFCVPFTLAMRASAVYVVLRGA